MFHRVPVRFLSMAVIAFATALSLGIVDPAHEVVGSADADGDGQDDILWRNVATGEVWMWLSDEENSAEVYV